MNVEHLFNEYCIENNIHTKLSYDMPTGYETSFGTYDCTIDTLFINNEILDTFDLSEVLFFLYHELRHAVQYQHSELFSEHIKESLKYVILYNGTSFKLINGEWNTCKLLGEEEFFSEAYLNLPYEIDANEYAYNKVISLLGNSEKLQNIYKLFKPQLVWRYDKMKEIFKLIDNYFPSI